MLSRIVASAISFLLRFVAPAGLGFGLLVTLLHRAQARLVSNGVLPPALGDRFEGIHPAVREALARRGVRDLPPPREIVVPAEMTMRDHMQIADTHLLRAQDYVVALGAEGRGQELSLLFKRIRAARRALRVVADGRAAVRAQEPADGGEISE